MGTSIGTLSASLTLDGAQFSDGIDKATNKLGKFQDLFKASGGRAGGGGRSGILGAVGSVMGGKGGGLTSLLSAGMSSFGSLGGGMAGGAAVAIVTGIIRGIIKAFQYFVKIGDMLSGFVQHSNPAVADRWKRTWDDVYAVIGERAAPFLEILTKALRLFGDVLNTILPSAKSVETFFGGVSRGLDVLRGALGKMIPGGLQSSVGKAVSSVGFTSMEGLHKAVIASALGAFGGRGGGVQEQQLDTQNNILLSLKSMEALLTAITSPGTYATQTLLKYAKTGELNPLEIW